MVDHGKQLSPREKALQNKKMTCPLRVEIPIPPQWQEQNAKMIQDFLRNDDSYPLLKKSALGVNRGVFCPDPDLGKKFALRPCPLVPIDPQDKKSGYKATLSAFPVHWEAAKQMIDALRDVPPHPMRVLDVGSGSGYLLVLFSRVFQEMGIPSQVVGVELLPELVEFSKRQLCQYFPEYFPDNKIRIEQGDGWLGDPTWKEGMPLFDIINVGAAATALPSVLFKQLAPGGVLIIPLQCRNGQQYMYTIHKDPSTLKPIASKGMAVRYVPLVPTGDSGKEWEC